MRLRCPLSGASCRSTWTGKSKFLEDFLANYGYLALLVGTFFEGETIVVLGGLAAKFGHLSLPSVIAVSIVGTVLGDQLYFLVGRRYGKRIVRYKPQWAERADRFTALIDRWDVYLILSFRFMYGLRSIASFAFGMSSVPFGKFAVLNLVGAVVWATVMACFGYLLGKGAELVMDDVQGRGVLLLLTGAATGLLVWLMFRRHQRRAQTA